jgi:hypothetical protein
MVPFGKVSLFILLAPLFHLNASQGLVVTVPAIVVSAFNRIQSIQANVGQFAETAMLTTTSSATEPSVAMPRHALVAPQKDTLS